MIFSILLQTAVYFKDMSNISTVHCTPLNYFIRENVPVEGT
jgi:hypothetical protein